jgi:hypothetical protein
MLGGISIYSVYTRKLSQKAEYNKFKIHALVWQLEAQKKLSMNCVAFLICLDGPKIHHKKKHRSQ